jgi:hypothetical protein
MIEIIKLKTLIILSYVSYFIYRYIFSYQIYKNGIIIYIFNIAISIAFPYKNIYMFHFSFRIYLKNLKINNNVYGFIYCDIFSISIDNLYKMYSIFKIGKEDIVNFPIIERSLLSIKLCNKINKILIINILYKIYIKKYIKRWIKK